MEYARNANQFFHKLMLGESGGFDLGFIDLVKVIHQKG